MRIVFPVLTNLTAWWLGITVFMSPSYSPTYMVCSLLLIKCIRFVVCLYGEVSFVAVLIFHWSPSSTENAFLLCLLSVFAHMK